MKTNIIFTIFTVVLVGTLNMSCTEDNNGTSTTLRTTQFNGEQGVCTNGGVKLEVLKDGLLDEAQTQYICNGTQGQTGTNTTMQTTKFDGAQGECTNGGVKVEILIDNKVDDTQTQYICNGINGQNGTAGHNALITTSDEVGSNCANGGIRVDIGMDSNNNNALDIDEILNTKYICNVVLNEDTSDIASYIGIGDSITFGRYEQDDNTTNGKEPIKWRVLDKETNGKLLIISEMVLDRQPYNTTNKSITWEKSTIRSWLNGYDASYNIEGIDYKSDNFINTAFIAEERAKIVTTKVPAHANLNFSTSPGNATSDKIFLLSAVEAKNYFTTEEERKAEQISCNSYYGGCFLGPAFWCLRSPGQEENFVAVVMDAGFIDFHGNNVNSEYGIRPALWVQL